MPDVERIESGLKAIELKYTGALVQQREFGLQNFQGGTDCYENDACELDADIQHICTDDYVRT